MINSIYRYDSSLTNLKEIELFFQDNNNHEIIKKAVSLWADDFGITVYTLIISMYKIDLNNSRHWEC